MKSQSPVGRKVPYQALRDTPSDSPTASQRIPINIFPDSSNIYSPPKASQLNRGNKMKDTQASSAGLKPVHAASPSSSSPAVSRQASTDQIVLTMPAHEQASSPVKASSDRLQPVGHQQQPSLSASSSQRVVLPGHHPKKSSNMDEDSSKRKLVFTEIVTTERTYVHCLQALVQTYMKPMEEENILKEERIREIFSITPALLAFHQTFLEGLEKQLANWSSKTGVGDCFLKVVPFLKMYYTYVNNYSAAQASLLLAMETKPKLVSFLKTAPDRPDAFVNTRMLGDLPSLLVTPIQRMPRYGLLLNELSKNTPKKHPDRASLDKSLEAVKQATTEINEQKRAAELKMHLIRVDRLLKSKCPNLVQPFREFKGEVSCVLAAVNDKAVGTDATLFMFSDVLVEAKREKALLSSKVSFKYQAMTPVINIEASALKPAKTDKKEELKKQKTEKDVQREKSEKKLQKEREQAALAAAAERMGAGKPYKVEKEIENKVLGKTDRNTVMRLLFPQQVQYYVFTNHAERDACVEKLNKAKFDQIEAIKRRESIIRRKGKAKGPWWWCCFR